MINIIRFLGAIVDHDHAAHQAYEIPLGDHAVGDRHIVMQVEFLIELIAPHAFKVIMALVKQLLLQEATCIIQGSRVSRAHALEKFQ